MALFTLAWVWKCLWCSAVKLNVSALGTFPHGAWSDLCSFWHYLLSFLSYSVPFVFHGFNCHCVNLKKKKKRNTAHLCMFFSLWGSGPLIMQESGCCLTVFVFQITTAGTTVMRQAVVTPAPALSSSVTAAAASQITGRVMEIMTVGTTAMKPMQTAPIRVRGNIISLEIRPACVKLCFKLAKQIYIKNYFSLLLYQYVMRHVALKKSLSAFQIA